MDGATLPTAAPVLNFLKSLQFLLTPRSPGGLPPLFETTGTARKFALFLMSGLSRNCNGNIIFGFASQVNRKPHSQSYGMTGKTKWVHMEFAHYWGSCQTAMKLGPFYRDSAGIRTANRRRRPPGETRARLTASPFRCFPRALSNLAGVPTQRIVS
jgi:hypothetical protein